jgi:hypothetical protein
MRLHPGDQGMTVGNDGVHLGIAFMDLRAVKPMDPAVAVAGLATAFFLKCNPGFDFRTHSNLMNSHPLPHWNAHCVTCG